MFSAASSLVNKVWNYCNLLRDDGVSYGDYVEQLWQQTQTIQQLHQAGADIVAIDRGSKRGPADFEPMVVEFS